MTLLDPTGTTGTLDSDGHDRVRIEALPHPADRTVLVEWCDAGTTWSKRYHHHVSAGRLFVLIIPPRRRYVRVSAEEGE